MPIWSLWILKTVILAMVGCAIFTIGLLLIKLPTIKTESSRVSWWSTLIINWPMRLGLVLLQLLMAILMVTTFDRYVVKSNEIHQLHVVQQQLKQNQHSVDQHLKLINDTNESFRDQGHNIHAIQKLNAQAQALHERGNKIMLDYHWIYIVPTTKGWF